MSAQKQFVSTITSGRESDPGEPTMTVSTIAPDRVGDRVVPEGGDFQTFRKNPAVLWAHSYEELPVASATGLEVLPQQGLRMRFKWLQGDAFADRVRNAWDQGVIRAASLGFTPRRSRANEWGGKDFLEGELIEVSLVPVPANAEAVRALHKLFPPPERSVRRDEPLLLIEDDDDDLIRLDLNALRPLDDPTRLRVDPADIRPALHEALRALVRETLEPIARAAIMRTTGRVD